MAFEKAIQLIELAVWIQGRRSGVTLDEVTDRLNGVERTAQRTLQDLERAFDGVTSRFDHDGRKRWRMESSRLRDLLSVTAEDLAALDMAVMALKKENAHPEAKRLSVLSDVIKVLVPKDRAFGIEPDHEALLEAMGVLARPGPRPVVSDEISSAITKCLKGGLQLEVDYAGGSGPGRRRLGPLGILIGNRRYLVAVDLAKEEGRPQSFRMDLMQKAVVSDSLYARPDDFNLQAFSGRAFGAFENDKEFGEVVLRFSAKAAPRARTYEFHPSQESRDLEDGRFEIRFWASGHLEMAWHLYMWGADVMVIKPARLKALVRDHRRRDFESLP